MPPCRATGQTASMSPSPDLEARIAQQLEAVHHCDQRLVRTVDSLTEAQWRGMSLLPDWTRAHVVAHLALNAEGFSGALEAIDRGEVVPIYPTEERRDADIAALAAREPGEIRERLFAATTRFRDAVAGLMGSQWDNTVLRLAKGPAWPATNLPETRRREVEIHHADLDTAYSQRDWAPDFCADLLDQVTGDHSAGKTEAFSIRAEDLDRSWSLGADAPVVSGTAADLGWWLIGRGHGERLTSTETDLPHLGPWRRAPEAPTP